MKSFIFLLLLSFVAVNAIKSQGIDNNNFEILSDSSKDQPKYWQYIPGTSATRCLDTTTVHSGKYALKMMTGDVNSKVAGFHQLIKFSTNVPKTVLIHCWVRTIDCAKGAGIECSQLDVNENELNYTSSYYQESKLIGTNEWTKMQLTVFASAQTKQLDITCYFNGAGATWFDDISVDTIKENQQTAPIVTAYIDSLVKFVKDNSIITDSINWKILTSNLRSYAKGMQSYTEAKLLPSVVIDELRKHGDKHSSYMNASTAKKLKAEDIMGMGEKPEVKYLKGGIGYISMPAFASLSDSVRASFATETQHLIKKLDTENNICGWVVDLREDKGGSYPPMLIGLGPILGNGVYSLETGKNETTEYVYESGAIEISENKKKSVTLMSISKTYKLKNKNAAVAVLIGGNCGSSGECVALAFVGRKDTRLFGQPSAGYTKGNTDYTLPDNSMLFISAGVSYDRNGKTYADKIIPDELVEQPADDQNDLTLEKAKEWLRTEIKCR